MAKIGRKAELRRLAAKRGWYDGHEGREPNPPTKAVALPFANGYGENPAPIDEEQAYWDGYDEGRDAKSDSTNPYAQTPNALGQATGAAVCARSPAATG